MQTQGKIGYYSAITGNIAKSITVLLIINQDSSLREAHLIYNHCIVIQRELQNESTTLNKHNMNFIIMPQYTFRHIHLHKFT